MNDTAEQLIQNGYVFLPKWRLKESTISIGLSIGEVVDIGVLIGDRRIPITQTLRPHNIEDASQYRYSGHYGLKDFPLHTDLATFVRPPRYFILRCTNGTSTVLTRILPHTELLSKMDNNSRNRALFRPRRTNRKFGSSLLPFVFQSEDMIGARWDSLFLIPMNKWANQCIEFMSIQNEKEIETAEIKLVEYGDTLIVDNWLCFHGRGKVPSQNIDRKIERIYLSKIY